MVAASVICADTDEEARRLSLSNALNILQRSSGRMGPLPSVDEGSAHIFGETEQAFVHDAMSTRIIGSPDTVFRGLSSLVSRAEADEVMVSTRTHSYQARAFT